MSSKRNESYRGKIRNPLDQLYGTVGSPPDGFVPIEQIQLPSSQPRRYFDPQAQQNLVQSIRQHGILQPLLVRLLAANTYELVAGERRYRAAKEIGLAEVPIVERSLSDAEALQIALIENLQREDLNPIEETEAIMQLLALELSLPSKDVSALLYRFKHGADQAAKQTGHNVMPNSQLQQIQDLFSRLGLMEWQSFVKNRLPLLNLPADVLEAVMAGDIQYTKAIALSRVKDEKVRSTVLKKAIAENWSVNQIREHIKQLNPQPQEIPLKQRFDAAYRKAKKAKVWEDGDQQARLADLITELEALLGE